MTEPKDYRIEDSTYLGTQGWYLRDQRGDEMPGSKLSDKTNHCIWGPSKKPDKNTGDGHPVDLGLSGDHLCESKC